MSNPRQNQPPLTGDSGSSSGSTPSPGSDPTRSERPSERATSRGDGHRFIIEFGDGTYCRNFTISSAPFQGMIVRGAFSLSALSRRPEGMRDVGQHATRLPDLPGLRLAVDTRGRRVGVFDPLGPDADKYGREGDAKRGAETLDRFNSAVKNIPGFNNKYGPVATSEHELDDDQLKTILLEMRQKLDEHCISVVVGTFPTKAEIEDMPGRRLCDPMNQGRKPKYHDQIAEWEQSPAARV